MAALEDNLRKVPPQNLEAESSVLGGILLENEAVNQVLELLRPEDFYRESHRKDLSRHDRDHRPQRAGGSDHAQRFPQKQKRIGSRRRHGLSGVARRFRAHRGEYLLLRAHRAREVDSAQPDQHRDGNRHARLRRAGQRRRVSRQRRESHLRYLRKKDQSVLRRRRRHDQRHAQNRRETLSSAKR